MIYVFPYGDAKFAIFDSEQGRFTDWGMDKYRTAHVLARREYDAKRSEVLDLCDKLLALCDKPLAGDGYPRTTFEQALKTDRERGGSGWQHICACAPGSLAIVDRVTIHGHKKGCPHATPRTYLYRVDGVVVSGTLADYAKAYKDGVYSGDHVDHVLKAWDQDYGARIERDELIVTITIGNESTVVILPEDA